MEPISEDPIAGTPSPMKPSFFVKTKEKEDEAAEEIENGSTKPISLGNRLKSLFIKYYYLFVILTILATYAITTTALKPKKEEKVKAITTLVDLQDAISRAQKISDHQERNEAYLICAEAAVKLRQKDIAQETLKTALKTSFSRPQHFSLLKLVFLPQFSSHFLPKFTQNTAFLPK